MVLLGIGGLLQLNTEQFPSVEIGAVQITTHYPGASAEDIDNAMTKGVNYPKGLLQWADEKGIDWCVSRLDALYDEYREDRYRCSPLLRRMNKTGSSFH